MSESDLFRANDVFEIEVGEDGNLGTQGTTDVEKLVVTLMRGKDESVDGVVVGFVKPYEVLF